MVIRNAFLYNRIMVINCEMCEKSFSSDGARGRTASFCSSACRQRAYRRRKSALKRSVDALVSVSEGRWVRADGKRPIMRDGSPASSTDPATWTSFENVRGGAGDGFGVMLGSGLSCYDFDDCFDGGALKPEIRSFIESIPERVIFSEVSVSGRGLHVFVVAPEGRGSRRGGVEFYSRARFIRTTLNQFVI